MSEYDYIISSKADGGGTALDFQLKHYLNLLTTVTYLITLTQSLEYLISVIITNDITEI